MELPIGNVMMTDDSSTALEAQPSYRCKRMADMRRFMAGSMRSQERLAELNFDPLSQLVATHNEMLHEIEMLKQVREGQDIKGTPKFNMYQLLDLYDKVARVETELLRYGYSRVPESVTLNTNKAMDVTINLSSSLEEYKELAVTEEED